MSTDDKIKDIEEENKINLIILKREIQMDETKQTLKQAFEKTLENVDEKTRQEVYNKFEQWN